MGSISVRITTVLAALAMPTAFLLGLSAPAAAQTLSGPPGAVATGSTTWRSLADRATDVVNVKDYGGSIGAALAAVPAAGAVVYVEPGTYTETAALTMKSNTRLLCAKGATIARAASGWTGSDMLITNPNYAATAITDHDISVEGCTFDESAGGGGAHAIDIRMAKNVRILGNTFTGGGDATALLHDDYTVVADNSATGTTNACWDHWDSPADIVLRDNYCAPAGGAGTLVTSTDTSSTTPGDAERGVISGNVFVMGSSTGLAIHLQPAVSGAVNGITVSDNYIDAGTTAQCIRLSGSGNDDRFIGNTCKGGSNGGIMIWPNGSDIPSGIVVADNTLHNVSVVGGAYGAPIDIRGDNVVVTGNEIDGGSGYYQYWVNLLSATNVRVSANNGDVGSAGYYVVRSGVTGARITDAHPVAVSALYGCSDADSGSTAVVNNAANPSWNTTLTGGGSTTLGAFCNGTNWVAR